MGFRGVAVGGAALGVREGTSECVDVESTALAWACLCVRACTNERDHLGPDWPPPPSLPWHIPVQWCAPAGAKEQGKWK